MTVEIETKDVSKPDACKSEVGEPEVSKLNHRSLDDSTLDDSTLDDSTLDVNTLVISKLVSYCEQNQQATVVDSSTELEQLGLDSLALIEVVYELEEELGITLEPTALQSLRCVGDLVMAINRVRKSAAGSIH